MHPKYTETTHIYFERQIKMKNHTYIIIYLTQTCSLHLICLI